MPYSCVCHRICAGLGQTQVRGWLLWKLLTVSLGVFSITFSVTLPHVHPTHGVNGCWHAVFPFVVLTDLACLYLCSAFVSPDRLNGCSEIEQRVLRTVTSLTWVYNWALITLVLHTLSDTVEA